MNLLQHLDEREFVEKQILQRPVEVTVVAKIHLMYEDSEYTVDARPSDAIALALRSNAPVFAKETVLNKQSSEELEQWLENLKPEDFGKLDS